MKKNILLIAILVLSWKGNAQFDSNGNLNIFSDLTHQPFVTLGINQTDRWSIGVYEANNPSYARSLFIYENHTGISGSKGVRFLIKPDGNVGIGTVDPGIWKLAVNGNIRAKEIKVETGWSDFVFYNDYKLPTLQEVENHINEKGHLKDIPSAKEVQENGIFLGEMDSKLLQKIEELTLYTIEQEKKIKRLEEENKKVNNLKEILFSLQTRLEKLESKN